MNPERIRGFSSEQPKDEQTPKEDMREKNILKPDPREFNTKEKQEAHHAKLADELAGLKSQEEGLRYMLAETSEKLSSAHEMEQDELNALSEEAEEFHGDLEENVAHQKEIDALLHPLKGASDDENDSVLSPLDEHIEKDKSLAEKDWREEADRVTPPPLPSKRKKTEVPPPPPLDALVEAEMDTDDRLPEELVPGARAASQAEYELTGDEFEVVEDTDSPPVPKMTDDMLDNELTMLFGESERLEKERESGVLPADSARARERRELGDEATIRNEVDVLEKKVAHMSEMGFSQKNLERLLERKGVNPDKLAISGLYRARVKVKSLFDPNLRMLLDIYDEKTTEIADMKERIQTGKMRLEDPERYRRLMQDQRERLRK